jgi:hypothetical protein
MPTRRPQRLSTARIVLLAVLVTLALLCVGYLVYFVPALIRNARRQRELDPHMNPYDDSSSGSGSGGSGGDDDEHQQTPPPLQPQRQQPRRGAGARNSSSGFGDGLVPLDPNDPWAVAVRRGAEASSPPSSSSSSSSSSPLLDAAARPAGLPADDTVEHWFPEKTRVVTADERRGRWSEPALLQGYDPHRPNRACDALPPNVTVTTDASVVLGEVSVTRMPRWRERQLRGDHFVDAETAKASTALSCRYAFVLMVSNHRYVDGALVMAQTLWNASLQLRRKRACLVMLTSEKLAVDSVRQLALMFDVVKAMRTLGSFVPKSYYAPTFDKAYLWSLTEFRQVMFMDADHFVSDATHIERLLMSDAEDEAEDDDSNNNDNGNNGAKNKKQQKQKRRAAEFPANRMVAVGDHDYFQTGLMVIRPNMHIFVDLYLEFRYGPFGYNQWRARDGILIRNCFLRSNDGIEHPRGLAHYYGFFKPWFDVLKSRKITKEPIPFDKMYWSWWERYEALHTGLFRFMPIIGAYGGKARKAHIKEQLRRRFRCVPGGDGAGAGAGAGDSSIDRACFMWIQRHRGSEEYLLPVSAVRARWWNLRVPSLTFVLDDAPRLAPGAAVVTAAPSSCVDVCARRGGLVCRDDAFHWSPLSTCAGLANVLARADGANGSAASSSVRPCSAGCTFRTDGVTLPLVGGAGHGECAIHSFLAQKFQPRCDATEIVPGDAQKASRRVCPCVSAAQQNTSGVVDM